MFVQAVVQPAEGVAGTPELAGELPAFAREHIAGYKVPRRIHFRESLLRMPTGKLAKGPLRAEYLALPARGLQGDARVGEGLHGLG